jgi:transcriptional regulator with XRE-family HTH domain
MKKASFKELLDQAKDRDTYWVGSLILDFTEGLHKIMESNGVSRSELARRLGVSPAYVTKVLRGNVNFTLDSMVRLVRAAGGEVGLQVTPKAQTKGNDFDKKTGDEKSGLIQT